MGCTLLCRSMAAAHYSVSINAPENLTRYRAIDDRLAPAMFGLRHEAAELSSTLTSTTHVSREANEIAPVPDETLITFTGGDLREPGRFVTGVRTQSQVFITELCDQCP